MKIKTRLFTLLALFSVVALGCSDCGGAISPTGVAGLQIPGQMSLVEADESGLGQALRALTLQAAALTLDETTAYYTDPVDFWVYDDSMQSLNIINEILCSFEQTQYAALVNQGDYIALVDFEGCNKSGDKSGEEGNQSSAANEDNLEVWIINSSRASDNSPHIVKFWIEQAESEHEPASIIKGKLTITEGVSEANPLGLFHLDFQMVDPTETDLYAEGYLESVERDDGQLEFQFSMDGEGLMGGGEAVHVVTSADGSSGYAYTAFEWSDGEFSESGEYHVAFDENLYHAEDLVGGEERCLDRNNFDNHVFRYGVYNEDGSRLEIENPGFGVKYGEDYGWAGYYGIWLPEDISLENGLVLERANHDDIEAEYTLFVAPGRLIKHVRSDITLGDIKGTLLNYWDDESRIHYRAEWDGTRFALTATENCVEEAGCTWTDIETIVLDLVPGEWINFWRDGLGSLFFNIPEEALSDDTPIEFDAITLLTAEADEFLEGELTLYCYQQCLKANLTSEELGWQGDNTPFLPEVEDIAMPYAYVISAEDLTLTYEGELVAPVEEFGSLGGPNDWGIETGPLALSTDGLENIWDLWGQETYYTWETGSNEWNQYRGLIDSDGNAVVFDPPIRLDYTHTDGVRYSLQYEGGGELHGIPWQQVEGTDRWYPLITIPDGSVLSSEGTDYYVKGLEIEQQLQSLNIDECSELTLQTLEAPPATYVDPEVGSLPSVTDAPKVIKGVLTGSS